jgi:RimJ/RimL family protein N-acetyltransferase
MADTSGPADVADRFLLPDGTPARLRALVAGDRQLLRDMYAALSQASRYRRFLATLPWLPEPTLDYLLGTVDQINHVAVVLLAPAGRPGERAVGIGRIARNPDDPTTADIGISVADDWQGRGIGSALARALVTHRPVGVTRLVSLVAEDNTATFAIQARLGAVTRTPAGSGVYEVTIALADYRPPSPSPDS